MSATGYICREGYGKYIKIHNLFVVCSSFDFALDVKYKKVFCTNWERDVICYNPFFSEESIMVKKRILKSVKTKLILSVLALAAIPLVVTNLISYISTSSATKNSMIDSLDWSAWYMQEEMNNLFSKTNYSLGTLSASSSIQEFLLYGESAGEAKTQMQYINSLFDDGNQIVLSDMNGMMVLRSDDSGLVDISERDYWQGASSGTPTTSSIMVSNSTGVRSICVAVPVFKNGTSEVIGVLHRNYDLNQLHAILAEDDEESFLIDQNGIVAAHSEYEISAEDEPIDLSSSPIMTEGKENGSYQAVMNGVDMYVAYVKEPITGYTIGVAMEESVVTQSARDSTFLASIVGLILLISGIVFSYLLAVNFVKPLLAVNKTISSLAHGQFEKINEYTNRQDEYGDIINNTNSVIDKLDGIVGSIKKSSDDVNVSSDDLALMANQISATSDHVANAVQQIAGGAAHQADEIQMAADETRVITEAVDNVEKSTKDMSVLADRMKEASQSSSESLAELQDTSSEMTRKIEEISKRISSTQQAISNINDHVEGISGIAAQTNLLSLNASIEAARAGEAGKGFAVVAEEIRQLADDSESLASEIRIQMDELLAEAEKAVAAASLVRDGNIDQQKALSKTLEDVEGMLGDIEETVLSVRQIASETDTCVAANTSVSKAMTSLSAISEENAASTETTGAAVQELSATITTLADAATDLKEIANQLNEEIQFFK